MEGPSIFDIQGLWRPSIFSDDLDLKRSIFEDLQPVVELDLATEKPDGLLFENTNFPFELPPLEETERDHDNDLNQATQPIDEADESGRTVDIHEAEDTSTDVWNLDVSSPTLPDGPKLHTWEAFQLKREAKPIPRYLTEAGNGAFDALLQEREGTEGVLPQDVALQACCHLVLGRSSVFFTWDESKNVFARTLKRVPISGTSLGLYDSLVAALVGFGSTLRRLGNQARKVGNADCSAFVAFKRAVAAVIEGLEQSLHSKSTEVRSLLQLQASIQRPREILESLDATSVSLASARTDEDVISILSDQLTTMVEVGDDLALLYQAILTRVSAPWLQKLAEDVGLFIQSWDRSRDDAEHESDLVASGATNSYSHSFLTEDERTLIKSTRDGIRLLRQHDPNHSILQGYANSPGSTNVVAEAWAEVNMLLRKAHEDEARLATSIDQHYQECDMDNRVTNEPALDNTPDTQTHTSAMHSEPQDGGAQGSDLTLPELQSTSESSKNDLLTALTVVEELNDMSAAKPNLYVEMSPEPNVLAPLRPLLEAQARLVNKATLSLVFATYQLRKQLAVHRDFHLLGNGTFVSRLATAFFSSDVQSAERKRGNIPTSQTMGLRLGTRSEQKWPPASSELRLTLMNVLNESHTADGQPSGDLSFAIRELSDAEIDRVVDPTSIYALDFLRLQYAAPKPLNAIFNPAIVAKYDSIFRTLLVHLRMRYTATNLSITCRKASQSLSTTVSATRQSTLRRLAWKINHLITAFTAHTMDVAISEPCKHFISALDQAQDKDESSDASAAGFSIRTIVGLHESCLEDIRGRMFLQRKQEKIRHIMEKLFDVVLKSAASIMHASEDTGILAQQFEKDFDELMASLLQVLEEKARKPGRGAVAGMKVVSEQESARILLARLDWKGDEVRES